jgi:YHS domain-containing protein
VELDEPRTFTQVEYDGQLYYFCCMDCRKKFETDPEQFIPTVLERQTQFVNRALDH